MVTIKECVTFSREEATFIFKFHDEIVALIQKHIKDATSISEFKISNCALAIAMLSVMKTFNVDDHKKYAFVEEIFSLVDQIEDMFKRGVGL